MSFNCAEMEQSSVDYFASTRVSCSTLVALNLQHTKEASLSPQSETTTTANWRGTTPKPVTARNIGLRVSQTPPDRKRQFDASVRSSAAPATCSAALASARTWHISAGKHPYLPVATVTGFAILNSQGMFSRRSMYLIFWSLAQTKQPALVMKSRPDKSRPLFRITSACAEVVLPCPWCDVFLPRGRNETRATQTADSFVGTNSVRSSSQS